MGRRRQLLIIAPAAAIVASSCGGVGSGTGVPVPTGTPLPPFDGLVIEMVAEGETFSLSEIEVVAGEPFRILLDNRDAYAHAVAIAVGETAAEARAAPSTYQGTFWSGPGLQAYDVPALEAGRYWFFCQPHANMNGTVVAG